jgi:hypothetical protein
MTDPIHSVLYDLAKDIVDTVEAKKSRLGAGHLAEGTVIQDVQDLLTKRLREAGFVRVEHIS